MALIKIIGSLMLMSKSNVESVGRSNTENCVGVYVCSGAEYYERQGFHDELNNRAQLFLASQGVSAKMMGGPQGALIGPVMAKWVVMILSCLLKILPILKKAKKLYRGVMYKSKRKTGFIILEASGYGCKRERDKKCVELLYIAYSLATYLRKEYPIYDFSINCRIHNYDMNNAATLVADSCRINENDINNLVRFIPKMGFGRHSAVTLRHDNKLLISVIEYFTESQKSVIKKYLPFFRFMPLL